MAEKTSGNSLSPPDSSCTRTGRGCCLGPGSCLRASASRSFTPRTPLWPHRSCGFARNGCFLLGLQIVDDLEGICVQILGVPFFMIPPLGFSLPFSIAPVALPLFPSSERLPPLVWSATPCVTSKTWEVTTGEKPGADVLTAPAFPFANLDTPHIIPGCISGPPLHSKCCFLKRFVWDFPSVSAAKTLGSPCRGVLALVRELDSTSCNEDQTLCALQPN